MPGRELRGVHFAMEYLTAQNRRCQGDELAAEETISAAGKQVVIIGGGDTGADCLGTALRQGAAAVRQLEVLPRPPDERAADNPWPEWPRTFRVSSAHEEGGERLFAVSTDAFIGDAHGPRHRAARDARRTAHDRRPHGLRARFRLGVRAAGGSRPAGHGVYRARSVPAICTSSACA